MGFAQSQLGIETRVFEKLGFLKTRGPGKPAHFPKPETRVYDALKPGFQVYVFRTFPG